MRDYPPEDKEMAAKGQSTRDKFFLDFVAGATQLADPFGKERNTGSKNIEWLPDLLFTEHDAGKESAADLRALIDSVPRQQVSL
jgi:hypothetical protein